VIVGRLVETIVESVVARNNAIAAPISKSKRDVESFGTSRWDTRETESTVSVGLIDPSVQEALGVDEDDEDGHSLEQSDV
jgi:hypothetical protein